MVFAFTIWDENTVFHNGIDLDMEFTCSKLLGLESNSAAYTWLPKAYVYMKPNTIFILIKNRIF